MRILLEQVNTIDFDDLRKQVASLSNREKIIDADVKEDRSRIYRFGTVAVRWSYLSEKWVLQDGVAIEGTYETAKEAVRRAKEVSGYEEETQDQIIHTEPVPMDFDGTIPLDVIQSFQPTPVSPPVSGGLGGGPVSLNVPSIGGGGAGLGDLPSPLPGGSPAPDLPEPAGSPAAAPDVPSPTDMGG